MVSPYRDFIMIPQTWHLVIFSYYCYWIKHDAISSEKREIHTHARTHARTYTHKYIYCTLAIYTVRNNLFTCVIARRN